MERRHAEVAVREDGDDARRTPGGLGVDRAHDGMGVRGADKDGPEKAVLRRLPTKVPLPTRRSGSSTRRTLLPRREPGMAANLPGPPGRRLPFGGKRSRSAARQTTDRSTLMFPRVALLYGQTWWAASTSSWAADSSRPGMATSMATARP